MLSNCLCQSRACLNRKGDTAWISGVRVLLLRLPVVWPPVLSQCSYRCWIVSRKTIIQWINVSAKWLLWGCKAIWLGLQNLNNFSKEDKDEAQSSGGSYIHNCIYRGDFRNFKAHILHHWSQCELCTCFERLQDKATSIFGLNLTALLTPLTYILWWIYRQSLQPHCPSCLSGSWLDAVITTAWVAEKNWSLWSDEVETASEGASVLLCSTSVISGRGSCRQLAVISDTAAQGTSKDTGQNHKAPSYILRRA